MMLVMVFLTNFKPQLLITLNFKIMKQRILLLMYLVMLAIQGWAAPVDESSARAIVQDFVIAKRGINPNSMPTSSGSELQLLHAEMSSVSVTQNAYYIYNTGDGFVIVAGDDRAEQILGYGDEELDMNDIPCGMQFLLDSYKEQIDYLFENPGLVVETPSMNAPRLTATSVAPLLTAKYSQGKPFYNLTPIYNGSHCKTGCSCVALCQVMHYWQYPTITVPSVKAYTTSTHNIYMPELPSDRFHWNYIKADYSGSYTADEAYSIAKLMKYAGQAMEMDYSPDGSGATVSKIRDAAILFGYDHNAEVLYKENYTDAQWAAIIQAELSARRPIIYAGWSTSNSSLVGHAFNIDGYNASKNKYHINWGWGSSGGYYALNAFNTSNYHFNDMQQMIVGLKPQSSPEIEVNPTSKSFSILAGQSRGEYISVNGYALTGDLMVKLNNGGNIYSIEKNVITRDEAAYGVNLMVWYKPTEPGTSNASVTISGGGAASKTISLSGTAHPASVIHVPSSLSFSAATGETKTATFTVTCPNAISDLSLKLNNGGSIYSINKTSISKSAAINGATVTVTYKPTEAGSSNASITISGGGAEPKTVNLSGTAIKPVITVNPTYLYFTAIVGETKTATFTVTATDNLAGDLSVKVRNSDPSVSIDKTTIAKNDAINCTTVTVTYKPTEGESRGTFIDISGGGADTKSIALTTHATKPEIIIEPESLSFCSYVNNAVKQTFKVKGYNLTNDLSFAFSDNTSTYRIGSINTMISGSNFTSNVEVIYNPSVAGTSNAILTVNCGNAEPKTIVLTGVAKELPVVNVDVNSLSFEPTYTGYQTSRSITISCPNLPDNLQLSLSNNGTGSFGLSKSVITPEAAATGAPVTVYFSPTTGGGKHAKLNICYDGCTLVTIPLSGIAIKSDGYITAWPTSLEFETQPSATVTKTFNVSYSYPNGSIMISSVGSGGDSGFNGNEGSEGTLLPLNAAISGLNLANTTIIPFDGTIEWRRKDFIGPILPILFKSLSLEVTGDDCFEISPAVISLRSVPCSKTVTVTYHPESVGEHDAVLTIRLSSGGSAKPFILPLHGTANDHQLYAPNCGDENNDLMILQNGTSINTLVNEMLINYKVYAEGQNIIIDCPEAENAIISDIAGHAWKVNLQAGHNEIPVNASGIYIVRIREKSTKLMIK